MSKRILIAISALVVAGCFFGGESDSPTGINNDPKTNDSLPKAVKLITPGIYLANYDWIDSTRPGLESEFLINSAGTFSHYYVGDNEAFLETRGKWLQRDSALYFSELEETEVSGNLFNNFTAAEDDTNAVRNITDTSFTRLEWTILRQKPYWISYVRKTYSQLTEGTYQYQTIDSSDTVPVTRRYKIDLKNSDYNYSEIADTSEIYQISAKFSQIGSFLAIEGIRDRAVDSTNTFIDNWRSFTGANLTRMQVLNDTSFTLWTPGFFGGTWDVYSKSAAD